jgi:hypothetical protein
VQEEQPPRSEPFSLNDTILVAAVTGIGYAVVSMFQSGTLRYYGLPSDLNKPDLLTIFTTLGAMFSTVFFHGTPLPNRAIDVLLVLPLVALMWPKCPVIGLRNALLKKYPGTALILAFVGFVLTPFVRAPWVLILYGLGGMYFWWRIRREIESRPGLRWAPRPNDAFWVDHLSEHVDRSTMRIILVALVFMPVAYYLGYEAPSRSDDILLLSLRDQANHVNTYATGTLAGDGTILIRLIRDPAARTLKYTGSVALLKTEPGKATDFSGCRLAGPVVEDSQVWRSPLYPDHPKYSEFHLADKPDCADVFK